jgi:hypothetical protein
MCDVNEVAGPNITELLSWASDMAGTDSETCVFLALMAGSPNGLANAFCNKQLNIMCEVYNMKKNLFPRIFWVKIGHSVQPPVNYAVTILVFYKALL